MTPEAASKERLVKQEFLIAEYEDQLVEIRGANDPVDTVWGRIKTIGVEWVGADQFEVIINLEGRRLVMAYSDFIQNTKVL